MTEEIITACSDSDCHIRICTKKLNEVMSEEAKKRLLENIEV